MYDQRATLAVVNVRHVIPVMPGTPQASHVVEPGHLFDGNCPCAPRRDAIWDVTDGSSTVYMLAGVLWTHKQLQPPNVPRF